LWLPFGKKQGCDTVASLTGAPHPFGDDGNNKIQGIFALA
jgi:hypothetical protein